MRKLELFVLIRLNSTSFTSELVNLHRFVDFPLGGADVKIKSP